MTSLFANAQVAAAVVPLPTPTADADVPGLLAAAATGSDAAFAQLVKRHQSRVFSLALRLTGRRDEAEELAQDAFLQLHANLRRIGSGEHLRFWLCRTVTHRSIDQLRRRARQPRLVAEDAAGSVDAQPDTASSADHLLSRRLVLLLLQLPELARAVVVLRYQEDLDPVDIARTLDMPVNTVKSHLRRSLDWLREQGLERSDVT